MYLALEQQLSLFRELVKDEPLNAQIVGKNILIHNPSDYSLFLEYFKFCLNTAKSIQDESICDFLLKEAESSLQRFSESCIVDAAMLQNIRNCSTDYLKTVDEIAERNKKRIISENRVKLKKLEDACKILLKKGKKDDILTYITSIDSQIEKELMSDKDKEKYDELSQKVSDFISEDMLKKQRVKSLEALNSFKKAFDEFNANSKYKKEEQELCELLKKYLLGYAVTTLDSEVTIYYNYVYNFIFGKVRDELKYKMVEWAIECQKK